MASKGFGLYPEGLSLLEGKHPRPEQHRPTVAEPLPDNGWWDKVQVVNMSPRVQHGTITFGEAATPSAPSDRNDFRASGNPGDKATDGLDADLAAKIGG